MQNLMQGTKKQYDVNYDAVFVKHPKGAVKFKGIVGRDKQKKGIYDVLP